MIYDNSGPFSHRSLRRPLRRQTQLADGGRAEDKALYIIQVAGENPGITPDEVYEEIVSRGRHDIPKDMVRRVLA